MATEDMISEEELALMPPTPKRLSPVGPTGFSIQKFTKISHLKLLLLRRPKSYVHLMNFPNRIPCKTRLPMEKMKGEKQVKFWNFKLDVTLGRLRKTRKRKKMRY